MARGFLLEWLLGTAMVYSCQGPYDICMIWCALLTTVDEPVTVAPTEVITTTEAEPETQPAPEIG